MRTRFLAVLALGLLASQSAGAVVIDGKEWRQLTETTHFSWLMVNNTCGSGLCSGSIGGISLDGWYWADNNDIRGLFEELVKPGTTQFPTSTTSYMAAADADIANAVTSIFAPTSIFNLGTNTYREVRGLSRSSSGSTATMAYLLDSPFATSLDYAAFDTQYPKNLGGPQTGVWLYKPAATSVAEPASLALFGLGLAGIAYLRRRRIV